MQKDDIPIQHASIYSLQITTPHFPFHVYNRFHLRTYPRALALSVGFLLNADPPVRIHAAATQTYGMALPPVDLTVLLNLWLSPKISATFTLIMCFTATPIDLVTGVIPMILEPLS